MVSRYGDLYLSARRALLKQEEPQRASMVARELLRFASGKEAAELIALRDQYACEEVCIRMAELLARAVGGEPLAYILGQWDFYGMTLYVNPDVLIPRDDTCAVTELAIQRTLYLDPNPRILDLCTGSGCIGLALANRVRDARVTLADVSKEALAVAKKNTVLHKLTSRVSCLQVDALQPAPGFLGTFDLIVSNPPYIRTEEMAALDASVREFEPHLALEAGPDGLQFYRAIVRNFYTALKPGGWICLEFGMGQADAVCELLAQRGFQSIQRKIDFSGIERAVSAQKR